jgi:hypothetical protein
MYQEVNCVVLAGVPTPEASDTVESTHALTRNLSTVQQRA